MRAGLLDYLLDFSGSHPDVIPFLDIGVDFTRYGLVQCTSLQTTVIAGQPGLAQSLLNLGVRTDTVDGRGYTPLMAALLYGQDGMLTV